MIKELTDEQRQRRSASRKAEDFVIRAMQEYYFATESSIVRFKSKFSRIDGAIVNEDGYFEKLFEIKCRNLSSDQVHQLYNSEVAVDCEKLNAMQKLSEMLMVPSALFVCTLRDGFVYELPVTNRKGGWEQSTFKVASIPVPRIVGGEPIVRRVAFFPISTENLFEISEDSFVV